MQKFKKIILFNLLFSSLIILLPEFILGSWLSKKPYASKVPSAKYNQKLSIVLKGPNWDRFFAAEATKYTRDENGYRGYEKVPQRKILTIGGSTTDQMYIDDAFTWSEIAENFLNKNLVEKVDIINGGVDGQSSLGHYFSIKNWHAKSFKELDIIPEAIVFYIGFNEIHLFTEKKAFNAFNNPSPIRKLHNKLKENSFFYKRIMKIKWSYIDKMPTLNGATYILGRGSRSWNYLNPPETIEELPRELTPGDKIAAKNYSSIFTKLLKVTEEKFPSTKIIIIQQFIPGCRYQGNRTINRLSEDYSLKRYCTRYKNIFSLQDKIVKEINRLNNSNIVIIPMYKEVVILDKGFYDIGHNTKFGSIEVGKYIGGELIKYIEPTN